MPMPDGAVASASTAHGRAPRGVCCTAVKADSRVAISSKATSAPRADGLSSQTSPEGAFRVEVREGEGTLHALDFKQDLANIQLQLQRLLAGQAELQASVLRLSEEAGTKMAPSTHPLRGDWMNSTEAKESNVKGDPTVDGFPSIQDNANQIKKAALLKLFKNAQEHERLRVLRRQHTGAKQVMKSWISSDQMEMTVDSIMAVIIFLNAIFIGIASDLSDDGLGWLIVDATFSALFIIELTFKIITHGLRHFTGPGFLMNCIDFFLITADVVQLILRILYPGGESTDNGPPASVFRTVRLVKIARVLRLANMDVFKDLLQMMQGMMGGMSTLFWAMIFFLLIVYVAALLFRELLGRRDVPNVREWFDSVPRSMFSTFRCSFGDCSTIGGQPIFEFVQQDMGTFYSLVYCLFVFSITIGLFNVISAIFVETTMTVDELFEIEVPRVVIDETIKEPDAKEVLDELDIHPQDRTRLSDIFDPDNGGTVALSDVAAGIRRLRGEPRRSDIVCVDLMIRTIQVQVGDTLSLMKAMAEKMGLQVPS